MMTPEFRFRAKFAVITLSSAVCLALASEFPSDAYFQWLIRGVVAGLLLLPVPLVLRWWLVRIEPTSPEDVRRKIRAQSKWIMPATLLSIGVAYILVLVVRFLLPASAEAFIFGFGLGFVLSIALLVGPALWQSTRPRPPERKVPLEPEESPNRIHVPGPRHQF
jgi:O-antigen/teichoic acid export membrane protein